VGTSKVETKSPISAPPRGSSPRAARAWPLAWPSSSGPLSSRLRSLQVGGVLSCEDQLGPRLVHRALAFWMQTTGASLLAVKRCSPARVRMPAKDGRSAPGLLYRAAAAPRGAVLYRPRSGQR
jgi:hypothetical protein